VWLKVLQNFLSEIIKYIQLSKKQKENIQKTGVLIDFGKYTHLTTDIHRL